MRLLRIMLLVALGLFGSVAIFEVMMRLMALSPWWRILPAVSAQFDGPDREIGYAHRPNASGLWLRENRTYVTINSQGLRDRARTSTKVSNIVRIAVAGDSITEGLQVDESDLFTIRAENALNSRGYPVELLNFGLSGATPLQQLLFVANRGPLMGIDAAIFVFSAADFLNSLMRDDRLLPAYIETPTGELVIGRSYRQRQSHQWADRMIGRVFFWLVDHSFVASTLYSRAKLGILPSPMVASNFGNQATTNECAEHESLLKSFVTLWAFGEPEWAGRRLDRYLADVSKLLSGKPATFLMSGFGSGKSDCPKQATLHREVLNLVRSKIESAGHLFVDLDSEKLKRVVHRDELSLMHGFGSRVGGGHLNSRGHEIYARILENVVELKMLEAIRRESTKP